MDSNQFNSRRKKILRSVKPAFRSSFQIQPRFPLGLPCKNIRRGVSINVRSSKRKFIYSPPLSVGDYRQLTKLCRETGIINKAESQIRGDKGISPVDDNEIHFRRERGKKKGSGLNTDQLSETTKLSYVRRG